MHRLFPVVLSTLVVACGATSSGSSGSSGSTTGSQASALESAQCSMQGFGRGADACLTAYTTCASATGADVAGCRATLAACLPGDPSRCDGHGHGGPGLPPPEWDGAAPPPPGSGGPGAPPPPPPPRHEPDDDDDDQGDGGAGDGRPRRGGRGHGHGHGPEVRPDPAAIKACVDARTSCLTGDTDVNICLADDKKCMQAAFEQAFQSLCADAQTKCSAAGAPADACARIAARCAQGVAPGADAAPAPQCN